MDKKLLFKVFCITALQSTLAQAEQVMPGIEFLEYLADTENKNGEWVDPLEMKELAQNDQTEELTQEKGNE